MTGAPMFAYMPEYDYMIVHRRRQSTHTATTPPTQTPHARAHSQAAGGKENGRLSVVGCTVYLVCLLSVVCESPRDKIFIMNRNLLS